VPGRSSKTCSSTQTSTCCDGCKNLRMRGQAWACVGHAARAARRATAGRGRPSRGRRRLCGQPHRPASPGVRRHV
jgi:hypothetical protein